MRAMPLALAVLLAAPASGVAQTPFDQPGHRVEVDAGGGLFGGAALGAGDANLRANAQARQPFRLFAVDSTFESAPSLHVRAAVGLTRRFGAEGGVTWSRPEIRISVSADAEGAAPLTSVERIDQYVFDASLVMRLDGLRAGARLVPFVAGGAGYLRQLHEGRTLIEHGQVYHAGGGVKYLLFSRTSGFVRSTGLRGDARLQVLRGGISFEDRPRPHAAISGGVFLGF